MKRLIVVTLSFEGIHHWPECPIPEMAYLREKHRHVFTVKAAKEVTHNDRDIETIMFKGRLALHLATLGPRVGAAVDLGRRSCEDIADHLIKVAGLAECEVLEDGENGARLIA